MTPSGKISIKITIRTSQQCMSHLKFVNIFRTFRNLFGTFSPDCNYPDADWSNSAAVAAVHRAYDLQTSTNCDNYVDDCLASAQDGDHAFMMSCQGK